MLRCISGAFLQPAAFIVVGAGNSLHSNAVPYGDIGTESDARRNDLRRRPGERRRRGRSTTDRSRYTNAP